MKPSRGPPIPAIVALATVLAGAIGIWRGMSQGPEPEKPAVVSPVEAPLPAALEVEPGPKLQYGALAGTVRLPDGSPAAGAKVTAHVASFVGKPSLKAPVVPADRELVADAQGHFSLEVSLDWSWTLRAQKDELAGVAVEVMPPDAAVVIQLQGAQAVRVRVVEKNGQGVAGVPVGLAAQGKPAPAFEAATDGAGAVTFHRVPLGRWQAVAAEHAVGKALDGKPLARERRRAQAAFELSATAPAEVVLEFAALGKIRGRVTAPPGTELSPLVVYAVPPSVAKALQKEVYGAQQELLPHSYAQAQVAADGRFELSEVAGPQGLLVPHPTLIHAPVVAEPDGPEAQVALFKDKAVKGRVLDSQGQPVAQFSINGAAYKAPDGRFEYVPGGPPGAERPKNLPLVVTADGFTPLEKQVALGPGDTDVGDLKLSPGRTFTLTVVEDPGGAPVEELTFARLDGTALSSEPAEVVAPGVYRFHRLPGAPVTLSITRFGGANRKVQVAPGDTALTFRFGAGATVRGVVLGPNGQPAVGARVYPSGDTRATRLTNQEGKFTFQGLEPGELTLVVMFGRGTAIKKVTVPASGEVELSIALPAQP